jgi:hypothetical protein
MIILIFLSLTLFFAILGIVVGKHPYYKELRKDLKKYDEKQRDIWRRNQLKSKV